MANGQTPSRARDQTPAAAPISSDESSTSATGGRKFRLPRANKPDNLIKSAHANQEQRRRQAGLSAPDGTDLEPRSKTRSIFGTPTSAHHYQQHHYQHRHLAQAVSSSECRLNESKCTRRKSMPTTHPLTTTDLSRKIITIFIINAIMSHLNQLETQTTTTTSHTMSNQLLHHFFNALPKIVQAGAIECSTNIDCGDGEKICHENKCMCNRERPIEDKDRSMCLALALVNEPCFMNEQCLGNSQCTEGVCSCGNDAISIFNPSTKIYYCHPKRRLNQECNHDSQCPENAFCAINKYGCLCLNGYGPATVSNDGKESIECLPKTCSNSSDCESEHHQCEDSKCICSATHFDPHTAGCYKFGSTGGKPTDGTSDSENTITNGNITSVVDNDDNGDDNFYSILKDLTKNGDRMWLVILILIALTIFLLALIFLLVRKHYLGYCWTRHKIEYEPNNNKNSQPKNGYFNKNSITNKSFRKKNGETDEDEDDTAADRSNLVTKTDKKDGSLVNCAAFIAPNTTNKSQNRYVKVDMNDHNRRQDGGQLQQQRDSRDSTSNGHYYQPFHRQVASPLASSTSTPV